MENVNDAVKLISQAKELVKNYLSAVQEHEIWETSELNKAVSLIEEAVEKLLT